MPFRRLVPLTLSIAAAVLLAACGGGSSSSGAASCDVNAQKDWLRGYMLDWYYWTGQSPNPEPAGYATLRSYFEALRYDNYPAPRGPVDPWSNYQDSASYNQFFVEGRSTGYGFAVNGLEGVLPLKVRYVEPLSPAGTQVVRGDVIKAINGVPDSTLILQFAANNTTVLNGAAGDQITLDIERAGVPQRVVLTAADYALTPVPVSVALPGNVGYIVLKDFIVQAQTELSTRLNALKAAGITDLIIDLRYNGGGRISTANHFASEVLGARGVFATLQYNAKQQASTSAFP